MDREPPDRNEPAHPLIRILDRPIVALIQLLAGMARLNRSANVLTFDVAPRDELQVKRWENLLRWPPRRRVGCTMGVAIGITIGGAILWYATT